MKKKQFLLAYSFVFTLISIGFIQCSESEVAEAIVGNSEIMSVPEKTGPDFEFVYYVGSRFNKTVSKETVENAKSVMDIMPEGLDPEKKTIHNVKVTKNAVNRADWFVVEGKDENFNKDQLELLKSLDYGSNFSVSMRLKDIGEESEEEVDLHEQRKQLAFLTSFDKGNLNQSYTFDRDSVIRYMTVVPAHPATYKKGLNELIYFIEKETKEAIAIARQNNINPGKISFVINRMGEIEQVRLVESCNYSSIDKKMMEVVKSIPGKWNIAKNSKDELIEQELILFFGSMGC